MKTIRSVVLELIDLDDYYGQRERAVEWPRDFRRFRMTMFFTDGTQAVCEESTYIDEFQGRVDRYLEIMANAIKLVVKDQEREEREKREQAKKEPS